MSKPTLKPALQVVDLSDYANNILASEDKPLFDEAVEAGKSGALRAAYVMIWLGCAESLKRRFREAQKRDGAASKIVGEIEKRESEHKAVDKLILGKAYEYGFLSASVQAVLNHVYEMRCIYGHPYEEAPSREQVTHAAAVVVEHVLSQPVKLRHGFGKQILTSLLEDRNYLDDQLPAVRDFAKDIIPRLDENIHQWLLDKYFEGLEKVAADPSLAIFFRRGVWFCRAMLGMVGVKVFSHVEWHERISRHPKTLMRLCIISVIFKGIGKCAQDSLIGSIFSESSTRASVLRNLETLYDKGVLSKRQQVRFIQHVSEMQSKELSSAKLRTKTCFSNLIDSMKSRNWYVQNPAIDLVVSNGPSQAAVLNGDQQEELGRNILQAAEGGAGSAREFLEELSQDGTLWPFDVVLGIALESFTNEAHEIRFKKRHIEKVLSATGHLSSMPRKQLISQIAASIDSGEPKKWVDRDDFEDLIDSLKDYSWTAPLTKSLKAKAASLPLKV